MTNEAMPILAVVRCGDKSLHETWAVGDRAFDVAVSYFGDNADRSFPEATYVHHFKGGKWDGLYAFFQVFPETQQAYDYFWFPDDDIVASAADIKALIGFGQTYGLDLFQPALDNQSYFSHLLTLQHSSFRLRYSNFVEIMVPVLSRRLLKKTLPTMAASRSGFGLDFLWAEMATAMSDGGKGRNVAVVDAVCVRHTRPVGGSLHQFMKKVDGNSSTDELTNAIKEVSADSSSQIAGVAVPRIRILGGISTAGKLISGLGALWPVLGDLMFRGRNRVQAVPFMGIIKHALKACLN